MRAILLPLSALLCAFPALFAQVPSTTDEQFSSDLYLPAILQKAVKVEKVHPGDEVRLETVEAVLLADGLVMPEGARLYGHVRESEALQPSSESRLSIEVDRAEWGHKMAMLHAFVSGLGIRRQVISQRANQRCGGYDPDASGGLKSSAFSQEQDCSTGSGENKTLVHDVDFKLEEVKLQTDLRDGATTLISKKKNVHLPGGLLIMLHQARRKDPKPLVQSASHSQ